MATETRSRSPSAAHILTGYLALTLAVSIALAISVRKRPYFALDLQISRALQRVRHKGVGRLLDTVCGLGYPVQSNLLGALLIALLYRAGLKREAHSTLFAIGGSLGITFLLLLLVNRPRPAPELVQTSRKMWTTSFPSGHVLIFTSTVGFLCFLTYHSSLAPRIRLPLLTVLASIIILMGPARIYSGEHWASDVLAGYLLGGAWLAVSIKFYHRQHSKWIDEVQPSSAALTG